VASVQGKLAKKSALGTAIALAKRMNRVDLAVVVSDPLDERLARQSA
jgi:hypothetical protein